MLYRRLFDVPAFVPGPRFRELDTMRRQMERWFDTMNGSVFTGRSANVFPAVNLTESPESYFIRAELPGVKATDLDIKATGNDITLSGERKGAPSVDGARFHRREREAGKFSRVLGLPGDIESDRVEASLKNGILTIKVPKAEKAKPRQISIN